MALTVCPSCHHENPLGKHFCTRCGTALTEAAPPPAPANQTPDPPRLYVHSGIDRGTAFPLTATRTIVGRGRDADIQLADPLVSSRHVAIDLSGDGAWLEDLDSANGTTVDGDRLKPGERKGAAFGTMLEIGDSIVEIVAPGAIPRSAAPTITRSGRSGFFSTTRGKLSIAAIAGAAGLALIIGVVALTRESPTPTIIAGAAPGAEEAALARRSAVLVSVEDSSGTGIVIDAGEGLVATNYHVVAGSRVASIAAPGLADWNLSADVIATSPCDDIALLRVDGAANAWPEVETIEFVDGVPSAGDRAFALGYPATAGNVTATDTDITLTGGIVSNPRTRYDDPLSGVMPLPEVIQHDAAINPGNSGGPLVDGQGRLLGMNTAIYGLGEFRLEGQSYAITAQRVRTIVDGLLATGSIGDFGLLAEPYPEPVFEEESTDEAGAVIVIAVDPDGPAAEAGIETEALVVLAKGTGRIRNLSDWCAATRDASSVEIAYANDGDDALTTATLDARP